MIWAPGVWRTRLSNWISSLLNEIELLKNELIRKLKKFGKRKWKFRSTKQWSKCYNLEIHYCQNHWFIAWWTKTNPWQALIGYDKNGEVVILKPDSLEKRFLISSNKKPTLTRFACERNNHFNYACPYKASNPHGPKMRWVATEYINILCAQLDFNIFITFEINFLHESCLGHHVSCFNVSNSQTF